MAVQFLIRYLSLNLKKGVVMCCNPITVFTVLGPSVLPSHLSTHTDCTYEKVFCGEFLNNNIKIFWSLVESLAQGLLFCDFHVLLSDTVAVIISLTSGTCTYPCTPPNVSSFRISLITLISFALVWRGNFCIERYVWKNEAYNRDNLIHNLSQIFALIFTIFRSYEHPCSILTLPPPATKLHDPCSVSY